MTPDQLTQFSVALKRLCSRFRVTADEVENGKRYAGGERWGHPDLILVRQTLMVYGRSIGMKTKDIGHLLNRCPSNITHGCKTFRNRFDTEARIRELWDWLI